MAKIISPNIYSDASTPTEQVAVTVVDFSSILYSLPSATQSFVLTCLTLPPHAYSGPSETQAFDITQSDFILEFSPTVNECQNIRSINATLVVKDRISGTIVVDPLFVYEFALAPHNEVLVWQSQGSNNVYQVLDPSPLTPPGTLSNTFVLSARVSKNGTYITNEVISTNIVIDEVKPTTSAVPTPGTYPSAPLEVTLQTTDYSPTTIYYTTDGTIPAQTEACLYTGAFTITESTTIRAFAIDAAGNVETPRWDTGENLFAYDLDAISPVITVENISDASLGVGETAEVLWHSSESCRSAVIEVGGNGTIGSGTVLQAYGFVEKNVTQICNISSALLPVGTSSIYIYATDLAGNVGFSVFSLFFSSEVPVITIHEICRQTIASSDAATIIWSTSAGGAFEVRLGGATMGQGTLIASGTATAYSVVETSVLAASLTPNVTNDIRIYVATPSGNVGLRSATMAVDTLPPTLTINYTTADGPFTSPFILNISGVDSSVGGVPIDWGTEGTGAARGNISFAGNPRIFKGITQKTTEMTADGLVYSNASDSSAITISTTDFGNLLWSAPSSIQSFSNSSDAVNFGNYKWSAPSETQYFDFSAALSISNLREENKTSSSIRVVWETNQSATSRVEYGTNPSLTTEVLSVEDIALTVNHSLILDDLAEDTTYYYRIISVKDTISVTSEIRTFRTNPPADIIPPTIINTHATALSSTSIRVTWTTDELANSQIIYGLSPDLSDGIELPVIDSDGISNHTYIVSNLESETTYYFRVKSQDLAGNTTVDTNILTAKTWDGNAPLVSNVTLHVYRTTAVIRWKTSEPATGLIEYGATVGYGLTQQKLTAPETILPLQTQHEVLLTSLTPDRQYHFNIISADISGNTTGQLDRTFNTQANRDTRVAIYVVLDDASTPSPSNFDVRTIGTPIILNITSSTFVKYIAYDGFGNNTGVQRQVYSFDANAPVITFDRFIPEPQHPTGLVIGNNANAIVRFKVSEIVDYQIKNQAGTILASGRINGNIWTDSPINSVDMLEGDNYITIFATDLFGNSASLLCGNIIKDTIPPTTLASPPGGYYNEDKYITLAPQSLRVGERITIYYTIDGSLPTTNSRSAINEVKNILISNTKTLRWFSIDDVGNVEPAKFATYYIDRVAPTIEATPLPGLYDDIIEVELRANETATIFYTTDGTIPTIGSDIYTTPIEVATDTSIRCFAKDLAGNVSEYYVFEYKVKIISDKKFKKVIGFQDKYLLETEFNEAQDNVNRRIEEIAHDVVGLACIAQGLDIVLSDVANSFEFHIGQGKAYVGGKFITIKRRAQGFVPSPQQVAGNKTYHIIVKPSEPIFSPARPGQPGWEDGVPEITTYRLEESFLIDAVETLPDNEPHMELYEVTRPATAQSLAECTIVDKRHFFESLCKFQQKTKDAITELQANVLAMGLEIESQKLKNLLGLKNTFVDTFETTQDVDLSLSRGFRYAKTRFEL